jgi:hypothetical protein
MKLKPIQSIDAAVLDNVTGGACPGGNCGAAAGGEGGGEAQAAGGRPRLGGGLLRGLLGRLRGGQ